VIRATGIGGSYDAAVFRDDFAAPALDTSVWVPSYLPQWSSRAASAAAYALGDSELRLTVPSGHPVWCACDHEPPIRVSGIQSGVWSGPPGSSRGQQPFEGAVVRQAQEAMWGWTPARGRIEIRARMELSPRSMAAVWMVGLEDEPDRCGEICIFEVFGKALRDGTAEVGMGVHAFRDPALTEEWDAPRLELDVTEHHVYAAEWRPGAVELFVDGAHVKSVGQAPAYPMQMEVAVFDFPEWEGPDDHVPLLAIDWIAGSG
jgi:hypothetical protein